MITAGIDIGTRLIKACLVDDGRIIASAIRHPERDMLKAIDEVYKGLLKSSGIKSRDVKKTISTGYGSGLVEFAELSLTDEVCIAKAVNMLAPGVNIATDVGGLFLRIVSINENGFLDDSLINEPCAAGSGKFLELVCEASGINIEMAGQAAGKSCMPYELKSTCAVFAESEVVSALNLNADHKDVIAGVFKSIALKASSMLNRSGVAPDRVCITGGMALFPEFIELVETTLKINAFGPDIDPRLIPCFGAAMIAQNDIKARPASFIRRIAGFGS